MRIKSKQLLIAMAAGLALISPARAAVFNTTPLDMYPTTLPGTQPSFISNVFTTADTHFDDLWTFDISGPGAQAAANAVAFATTIIDGTPVQSLLALQLIFKAWNGTGYDTILFDSGVTSTPQVGPLLLPPHTGGAPGHGFYALEVLGNTPPGGVVSQYSGQLQVAAVPEPSTYALLLGGLILVGWRARRRSLSRVV